MPFLSCVVGARSVASSGVVAARSPAAPHGKRIGRRGRRFRGTRRHPVACGVRARRMPWCPCAGGAVVSVLAGACAALKWPCGRQAEPTLARRRGPRVGRNAALTAGRRRSRTGAVRSSRLDPRRRHAAPELPAPATAPPRTWRRADRSALAAERSELQLRGLADDLDGPVVVLHAGQRDDDEVALAGDLRFRHAETVDATADDRDRLIELRAACASRGASTTDVPPWRSSPSCGERPPSVSV